MLKVKREVTCYVQGNLIREQAEFLKKQCRTKSSWPVFKGPKEKKKVNLESYIHQNFKSE